MNQIWNFKRDWEGWGWGLKPKIPLWGDKDYVLEQQAQLCFPSYQLKFVLSDPLSSCNKLLYDESPGQLNHEIPIFSLVFINLCT